MPRSHHKSIRRAIEEQLGYEPDIETRNRHPLAQPSAFELGWELRCGPANSVRVFYSVETDENEVHILAVGVEEGDRLLIGGEEFEL